MELGVGVQASGLQEGRQDAVAAAVRIPSLFHSFTPKTYACPHLRLGMRMEGIFWFFQFMLHVGSITLVHVLFYKIISLFPSTQL